ncbi:hypothetical protein RI056_03740 [Komagataeibacter nataicola]|nr:hypothetical protein [Komagataeibacter nataicola]WNM09155.1 hypothetical protein RI056_03740 [Komagataeibacter nataicola]
MADAATTPRRDVVTRRGVVFRGGSVAAFAFVALRVAAAFLPVAIGLGIATLLLAVIAALVISALAVSTLAIGPLPIPALLGVAGAGVTALAAITRALARGLGAALRPIAWRQHPAPAHTVEGASPRGRLRGVVAAPTAAPPAAPASAPIAAPCPPPASPPISAPPPAPSSPPPMARWPGSRVSSHAPRPRHIVAASSSAGRMVMRGDEVFM